MNESQLQKSYNDPIYPRVSKTYSDKRFVNIDNGSMGGSHRVCCIVKKTGHATSTHLEYSLINFYSINYLNQ